MKKIAKECHACAFSLFFIAYIVCYQPSTKRTTQYN